MFSQFRAQYPTASLTSDLLLAEQGHYIVRAVVTLGGAALSTGLSAAATVELAEDQARERALTVLGIGNASYNAELQLLENPAKELPSGVPAQLNPARQPMVSPETQSFDSDWDADWNWPQGEISPESMPMEQQEELDPFPEEPESLPIQAESRASRQKSAAQKRSPKPSTKRAKTRSPQQKLPDPVDLSDIIAQTDIELKRLGWTHATGRQFLEKTYNKRSRQQLTDSELLEFLQYLKSDSIPQDPPF